MGSNLLSLCTILTLTISSKNETPKKCSHSIVNKVLHELQNVALAGAIMTDFFSTISVPKVNYAASQYQRNKTASD